jgi:hypothetical protein
MRAVLVCRSGRHPDPIDDVPVIRDLTELRAHVGRPTANRM